MISRTYVQTIVVVEHFMYDDHRGIPDDVKSCAQASKGITAPNPKPVQRFDAAVVNLCETRSE